MQNLRLAKKILPSQYLHGGHEPHEEGLLKQFFPHIHLPTKDGIKGLLVIETDSEEELTRYLTEYLISGMSLKLTPIWSSDKGVKIYEDMRR